MKIYKSFIPGISNEKFRMYHTTGTCHFISFQRLMTETIQSNVKSNEKLKGMVIDEDGVTLCLETK